MSISSPAHLQSRCDLLRSLHRPGAPLLLPNAWDVATAKAVVEAGFPVVATTSWGVAEFAGPVNFTRTSEGPAVAELGVVRVSWALYLYWDAMARFKEQLATLQG